MNKELITTERLEDVEAFLTEGGELIEMICVARSNAPREHVVEAMSTLVKDCCDTYDRYACKYSEDLAERLAEEDVKRRYRLGVPEKRRRVAAAFSRS